MLQILGLMEAVNEDMDGLVKDLAARKLDITIEISDVVRSHRVGRERRRDQHRATSSFGSHRIT